MFLRGWYQTSIYRELHRWTCIRSSYVADIDPALEIAVRLTDLLDQSIDCGFTTEIEISLRFGIVIGHVRNQLVQLSVLGSSIVRVHASYCLVFSVWFCLGVEVRDCSYRLKDRIRLGLCIVQTHITESLIFPISIGLCIILIHGRNWLIEKLVLAMSLIITHAFQRLILTITLALCIITIHGLEWLVDRIALQSSSVISHVAFSLIL